MSKSTTNFLIKDNILSFNWLVIICNLRLMAIKTFILGVLNMKYMHIVFRPSIVDFSVKSRAGACGVGT